MRLLRPLVILVGVLALTAAGTTGVQARPPVRYAALGDSYSAGVGADGSSLGAECDRNSAAYPALWASEHRASALKFLACSGATTSTVLSDQVPAIPANSNLVTITVGGNDVGFATIMQICALQGTDDCIEAVDNAENIATTALPRKLDKLFKAVDRRARSADVVVLDYPLFYRLGAWFCIGLSGTSRAKIDEGINVLDGVLQQAAARHGFAFSDVRDNFTGHELCGGSAWLHSVDFVDLSDSYHPTTAGQARGYLSALDEVTG